MIPLRRRYGGRGSCVSPAWPHCRALALHSPPQKDELCDILTGLWNSTSKVRVKLGAKLMKRMVQSLTVCGPNLRLWGGGDGGLSRCRGGVRVSACALGNGHAFVLTVPDENLCKQAFLTAARVLADARIACALGANC